MKTHQVATEIIQPTDEGGLGQGSCTKGEMRGDFHLILDKFEKQNRQDFFFFFFNQEGMKKPQCFVLIHFLIIYYFNMAVLILCNHLVNMKTMNILKSYFSPNSNFKCRNRTK